MRLGISVSDIPHTETLFINAEWRRFVVKYGSQGQSGKTIKLFQITPYVNDFQTLNNPGS